MIRTVTIVSLSAGTLGEDFVRHELELGRARLEAMGLAVQFAPHALRGRDYLAAHPEARAADLLWAFQDRETDLILSAIGGDDTYRLLPWLFDHGELAAAVTSKPFLGFSDTTMNHLMLHNVGLNTFYGQAFLPDVCELGGDMLPYTRRYLEELIATGTIRRVEPSDMWYEERSDFSPAALGTPLAGHPNGGFQLLQGPARFSGPILGAAWTPSSTSSTAPGTPTPPPCAESTACSPPWRTGRGSSCCWRPARSGPLRRSTTAWWPP